MTGRHQGFESLALTLQHSAVAQHNWQGDVDMNPRAIALMWALTMMMAATIAVGNHIAVLSVAALSAMYTVWAVKR